MKYVLIFFLFVVPVFAQDTCPPDLVCITREAALKAISDAEKVKAYEKEFLVKDTAIEDLKKLLDDVEKKYIAVSVENTGLKQQVVHNTAIIELLLKYARPKKFGLINL